MNDDIDAAKRKQFSDWFNERVMEQLVHVRGLRYEVKLCSGIKNETDLIQRWLSGKRVWMVTCRAPDNSNLRVNLFTA